MTKWSCEKVRAVYWAVVVDDVEFRRWPGGTWEELMGQSWEPCSPWREEPLEDAFRMTEHGRDPEA